MEDYKTLSEAVMKGDVKTALTETQREVDAGVSANSILNDGLITTMNEVGERFSKGLIFVPQMLRSARVMQECTKLLQPFFLEGDITTKGTVLMGTVKGDLHDIGKNLVSMMLEGAGFSITDLGVDVAPQTFVEKAQELMPDIIGLSALLSTTMPAMPDTIEALNAAGLRNKVKVMIGGAPVTEKYAQTISADAYASDAGSAVIKAKNLLGIS
jgi:5-methyltetrahydrofolate--homocysteine methyltransferase